MKRGRVEEELEGLLNDMGENLKKVTEVVGVMQSTTTTLVMNLDVLAKDMDDPKVHTKVHMVDYAKRIGIEYAYELVHQVCMTYKLVPTMAKNWAKLEGMKAYQSDFKALRSHVYLTSSSLV